MNSESDTIHMDRHYRSNIQSRTVFSYLSMYFFGFTGTSNATNIKNYKIDPIRATDCTLKRFIFSLIRNCQKMNPIYN